MAAKALPSISDLRQFISYDPDTGILTWLGAKSTNARVKIGGEAFGYVSYEGYKVGGFDKWVGSAHRVAWAIHTGTWAKGKIDHKNGIKTDNRIENLREATDQANAANRRTAGGKYSKLKGVTQRKKKETVAWYAGICVNGKRNHLGVFRCETAAALAYNAAAIYHFGEFATLNFCARSS